jgi:diadenosine tetraphosphate (Ap4A) HIT family hydrolase
MKSFSRTVIICFVLIVSSFILGAYLFADTQPRSFVSLKECRTGCLSQKELAGLVASVGIQKVSGIIPSPIFESDKIVVVHYPTPTTSFHEVIFPKRDIRDISQLTDNDKEYVWEMMEYIGQAIRDNKLVRYKIVSNGVDFQQMTYLHFHLTGETPVKSSK